MSATLTLHRATVVRGFPMLAALSAAAVLAFRGGGYTLGRTAPVVLAYLVAVAVWFALARPRLPRLSLTWVAAGGLAAFASTTVPLVLLPRARAEGLAALPEAQDIAVDLLDFDTKAYSVTVTIKTAGAWSDWS